MGVKSDRWIAERCSGQQPMIEPFVGKCQQRNLTDAASSPTALRATGTTCAVASTSCCSPTSTPRSSARKLPESAFVKVQGDRHPGHHPAQLVRAHLLAGVHACSARRAGRLLGQVNLRPLRDHRQRDTARAGVGGQRHPRGSRTQHRCRPRSAPARASLSSSSWALTSNFAPGTGSPATYLRGGSVSGFVELEREVCETSLQGPRRQVPGADEHHPPEDAMTPRNTVNELADGLRVSRHGGMARGAGGWSCRPRAAPTCRSRPVLLVVTGDLASMLFGEAGWDRAGLHQPRPGDRGDSEVPRWRHVGVQPGQGAHRSACGRRDRCGRWPRPRRGRRTSAMEAEELDFSDSAPCTSGTATTSTKAATIPTSGGS